LLPDKHGRIARAVAPSRSRQHDKIVLIMAAGFRCLYCPSRLPEGEYTCPACGLRNSHDLLRQNYWNLKPRNVRWQKAIRIASVVGTLLLALGIAVSYRPTSVVRTYSLGLPFVVGWALWMTAENLTRENPYFRARFFWMLAALLCGATAALLLHWLWMLPAALLAQAVWLMARRFDVWKARELGTLERE
jgi:hypothetical protein